jgi:large subunit ribosomal protein L13
MVIEFILMVKSEGKMKTFMAKKEEISREWYLIDAAGKTLGRLASLVATYLRGKQKPLYTPHIDTGDYVIVINAEKVRVSGRKEKQKIYYHHSGYPHGLKSENFESLRKRKPEKVIELAVKGMLPHNRLGRAMFKKLKVYAGEKHPHLSAKVKILKG